LAGGKGPDSTAGSADAVLAAMALASAYECVVAISGVEDWVTDGKTCVAISNGVPGLTKITGVGCSLSGLAAVFLAVRPVSRKTNPWRSLKLCEVRAPESCANNCDVLIEHQLSSTGQVVPLPQTFRDRRARARHPRRRCNLAMNRSTLTCCAHPSTLQHYPYLSDKTLPKQKKTQGTRGRVFFRKRTEWQRVGL
jgi:hypothetical protein